MNRFAHRQMWKLPVVIAIVVFAQAFTGIRSVAQDRVLGVDVSAWQGDLAASTWTTFYNSANRRFAFIRSSRGGTTGYDHRQGGYPAFAPNDNNDVFSLSQRYDDPYFVQNINRATAAGLFASGYHFARPDVAGNAGADEATHFLQQAGAFMRPGYLLPVLDLEAGNTAHTTASLSNWAVAFSNTIFNATGVRPIIYVNSSYANSEVNSTVAASMPHLWLARPAGSVDPLTGEPPPALPTYPNAYGVWNPTYPNTPDPHPWKFWQYSTTGGIPGYGSNIDKNVANGGIEFIKDFLVPAMWLSDTSGEWTTLTNWNSGQPATPPPGPPTVPSCNTCPVGTTGQLAPKGTQTFPIPRLPGIATSDSSSGIHDTVIIDRPGATITVTHSSGSHNIRKLLVRESLDVTGGSLTISYDPASWDSEHASALPVSARFSGPVSLSGTGSLSAHTVQIDSGQTFTLGGGTLTFDKINLISNANTKIAITGDVNINPLNNATATISRSSSSGVVDLTGGTRQINVGNGSADVDLAVAVPITNGGFIKAGPGTMRLDAANTFSGDVTVAGGTLRYNHSSGLANTSVVTVNNSAVLDMNGISDTVAAVVSAADQTSGVIQQGAANLTLAADNGDYSYYGAINGTGTLTKDGNATVRLHGNNSFGPVNVNGGSLILNGSNTTGTVTLNGGMLGGSGTVSGSVVANDSTTISPGTSIGTLNVGSLMLNSGSQLDFDLGSSGVSDSIAVNGLLALNGGTLNLASTIGTLAPFSVYNLISYTTLIGDIENLTVNGPEGYQYLLINNTSLLSLLVLPEGVPGDFNDDSTVDSADYVVWRKFRGTDVDLPNDNDLPGAIDQAEYDLWKQNFGQVAFGSAGSGSHGAIPEPTAAVLLVLGLASLLASRRHR